MKIYTVEIAFNCSKCDDNLPNRTVYNRHMKSHSKSKPVAPDQDYTDKNIHKKNAQLPIGVKLTPKLQFWNHW